MHTLKLLYYCIRFEQMSITVCEKLNILTFKKKGEASGPEVHNECDETEDVTGSATHSRRKRQGPLIEDIVIGK